MGPVLFIGPFPPPVHGQAASTSFLFAQLSSAGLDLRAIDVNDGAGSRLVRILRRLLRHGRAAAALLFGSASSVYLSVNANHGMYLTLLMVVIARLRGWPVVLHHHTYGHVRVARPAMAGIAASAGPGGVHVCVCDTMCLQLRTTYAKVARTLSLSNVAVVDRALYHLPGRDDRRPRVLGHLANLSEAKGIGRAIDALRAARAHGLADRLVVAGPVADSFARTAIASAESEFGAAFDYYGPVLGEDKVRFFREIDVFLFPSRYVNETQGIVNLEALAAGIPVIAFALCCIPGDLIGPGCCVVDPIEDFPTACCAFLHRLQTEYPSATRAARTRYHEILGSHQREFAVLASLLTEQQRNCSRGEA